MSNYIEDDIYESGKPFCNITIKLHDQIRIQRRAYSKLIPIWGDVGGFMEFVFIVFNLLSFLPIDILYEKEIVNKLFKFDLEKELVYVKKFKKSKLPIDFQELYKNSREYNTNIYDGTDKDKTENTNINSISYDDKIKNIDYCKTSIDDDKIEISNDVITNDDDETKTKKNIIDNDNEEMDNKNYIKNKFYSKSYHGALSSDNLRNVISKEELKKNEEEKIIEKIKMNFIYIYLCFCCSRKFKNRTNFLIDKGMEIFIDKMNIFTIFKKSINNELLLNKESIVEKLDIPLSLKKTN